MLLENIAGYFLAAPCMVQELTSFSIVDAAHIVKGEASPYSIAVRRVLELIPVLGSQPTGDAIHKPDGRLPLLSASPQSPSQPLRGLLPI